MQVRLFHKKIRSIGLIAAFFAVYVQAGDFFDGISKKKLIQYGWDAPLTSEFLQQLDKAEALPFDGYIIRAEAKVNGKVYDQRLWQNKVYKKEYFTGALTDLQACDFANRSRPLDVFLIAWATPGNVDWYDDEGWEIIAGNVKVLAWLAKQGGCQGICMDFESYQQRIFEYKPENGKSFAETYAQVRIRGAQYMRAIAAEYPDMDQGSSFSRRFILMYNVLTNVSGFFQ